MSDPRNDEILGALLVRDLLRESTPEERVRLRGRTVELRAVATEWVADAKARLARTLDTDSEPEPRPKPTPET